MERIWKKIINNKANPLCWPGILILAVFSWFYRIGLWIHNQTGAKRIKTETPVISVGNLTVGGSGKTPMVIFIADYFLSNGKEVGVVCSGYGRKDKVDIDGAGKEISEMGIDKIGDEMMEMAEILPDVYFCVASSKTRAAQLLDRKYHPDIIIIDDGFQHRRLDRRLDILLFDANVDLRRESIFPLGRLRENLRSAERADLILITKVNPAMPSNDFQVWLRRKFPNKIVSEVEFINDSIVGVAGMQSLESIGERNSYFFAGIGHFDSLRQYLQKVMPGTMDFRQFPDHCQYTRADTKLIEEDLEKFKPDYIITTYKDYTKLGGFDFGRPLYYLKLKLRIRDEGKQFKEKLDSVLEN